MKRVVGVSVLGAIMSAVGCGSPPEPTDTPRFNMTKTASVPTTSTAGTVDNAATPPALPPDKLVLAQINGQPITQDDLIKPLIAAHGLNLLLNIAQLDIAKQDARTEKLTVTHDDIDAELTRTLEKMFADQPERDRRATLDQYLEKRSVSRVDFDMAMELSAYFRKLAEKIVQGKITDEMVEKQFGQEYGETAKCRIIVLQNMQEVRAAQDRLKNGEDFAEVARTLSRDQRTAALGGELPPFSMQTVGYPEQFRSLAFALQPGQVSDPLSLDTRWYLIKLEQKFPPKAVKFQSVKESLRKTMYDRLAEAVMDRVRTNVGSRVMVQLSIHDPALATAFNTLKAQQEGAIRDRQKMDDQWRREREAATQPASSQPASDLAGSPVATAPATNQAASPAATAPAATATQPAAH